MARMTLLAVIATAFLAFVASGCGSSDSSDEGVAALDTGAAAAAGETQTTEQAEQDPQEAALEWAQCMREQGVDVPDPKVESGGRITIRPGAGARVDRGGEKFREAIEACGSPLGNARPRLTEEQREQLEETMLEFAKCMREQGIDFPDPDFSGGGVFRAGPGGKFDPDDPDFQRAQQECEPILQELEGVRRAG
jgi:hypothetical protein